MLILTVSIQPILRRVLILTLISSLSACAIAPVGKTTHTPSPLNVKHVVLISIDGLRPDAISRNNAPHIYRMLQNGHHYTHARTINRSLTLPGHASMLTGLPVSIHQVFRNKTIEGHLQYPTLPSILAKQNMKSAAFFSKKKMAYLFPPAYTDYQFGPGISGLEEKDTTAMQIAREFNLWWDSAGYHFTFVHIREPDRSGHAYGWMSDDYINRAIPVADNAVGAIVDTIKASRRRHQTLVIITADHGGKDNSHWFSREEDLRIPWIASHPQLKSSNFSGEWVSTLDTAPTILYLLGIPVPDEWPGKIVQGFRPQ